MRLHHLLSHDGQQLADFTFQLELLTLISLCCLCCRDSAATPLPKPPQNRGASNRIYM